MKIHHLGRAVDAEYQEFPRLVVWFSCGAASAVAAYQTVLEARRTGIETVIAYCDTGSEHPDNARFLADCEAWLNHKITILRNDKYADVWDVWTKRRYIAGINGAPCTTLLKKQVREKFERDTDLQVFGFDSSEVLRATEFAENQPEIALFCPLIESKTSKDDCFQTLKENGIKLPVMYQMGYSNNNCIGCPKGGAGYWNKIRRDFPETFARMAGLERELGARLVKATINGKRRRVFLDELSPSAGRISKEKPISCSLLCVQPKA